jgi:hypothetical protein
MGRRAELFVPELGDGEAARLSTSRGAASPDVQHRGMLLFASFQGQSVTQTAEARWCSRCRLLAARIVGRH